MKKIVALVLSLVMVLGLATTAFAATVAENKAEALDATFSARGWDFTLVEEDKADEKDQTFATYTITAVAKKDGVEAWWDSAITGVEKGDDEDVEIDGEDEFVIVAAEDLADLVLVDGKKIVFLAKAETYNEDGWDAKAEKVVLPVLPDAEADMKCCTLYAWGIATATFYEFEDELYKAATTGEVFNVAGEVVVAEKATMGIADRVDGDASVTYDELASTLNGADYVYTGHNYAVVGEVDSYENNGVKKVSCDICKKEFKFVEAPGFVNAAVAAFGELNYLNVGDMINGADYDGLYLSASETAGAGAGSSADSDAAAGDKVESAETFDAGIAMYVGMSVMAAAGSAVVLKKKD